MIDVLIVDDEEWIRYLLRMIIDWEYHGFRIAGEAANGFEGLNLINQLSPDIVITDIKMQKMDGIEMMAEAKANKPDLYFIMLSGYDSFEYAQKSLNLGAFAYLLKPVSETQLIEILEKLKQQKTHTAYYENLQSERLKYIREIFLGSIIDGETYTDEELSAMKEDCSILVENRSFYILIIHIGLYLKTQDKFSSGDLKDIVFGIIQEVFKNNDFEVYTIYRRNQVIAVISVEKQRTEELMYSILHGNSLDILEKCRNFINLPITIAYEGQCQDIRQLCSLFIKTQKLLDYRLVLGENRVIRYSDIEFIQKYSFVSRETEFDLIQALAAGNKEEAARSIKEVFNNIKTVSNADPASIKQSCQKILYCILDAGNISGVNMQIIIENEIDLLDQLDRIITIDITENALLHLAEKVSDAIYILKESRQNLTDRAKEFILKHYSEDISLERISESIYVSSFYLSSLFKKEKGQNLSDFITEVRINNACRLLNESRLKIFEVGEKVGYKDPKYFCRIFKKVIGVSPGNYKRKN